MRMVRGKVGWSPHERRHALGRISSRRVAADRRDARIVAVKTKTRIRVELGATPWTEHGARLGAHDSRVSGSAVDGIARVNAEAIAV